MGYTVPNQRVIKVHREVAKRDFLGIKNENWQAAARDLGAHSLMLYLYLASNADGYCLALSPVAVRQAIGMARSTYHDQFHKLVDKGYLVPSTGNTFEFYEAPKTAAQTKNEVSADGQKNFECTGDNIQEDRDRDAVLSESTEINNITNTPNNKGINNENKIQGETVIIQKPQVREIVIKSPKAEGKNRPKPLTILKEEGFVF